MRLRSAFASMLVLLLAGLFLSGGCGGSDERNPSDATSSGNEEEASGTVPTDSSPSENAQTGPDGQPVKTLADFPQDQDGAEVEAVVRTDKGDIVMEFYPDSAPVTVAAFLNLARSGFYNGLRFHRVEPGFVVQGGDPKSRDPQAPDVGTGGPGYYLPAEFNDRSHQTGTVAMARSRDPNSAGSQFYICLAPQPMLDGQYTVFGQVISGMEVVNQIQVGDLINEIVIRPRS